jgi:hypothetical protein
MGSRGRGRAGRERRCHDRGESQDPLSVRRERLSRG